MHNKFSWDRRKIALDLFLRHCLNIHEPMT